MGKDEMHAKVLSPLADLAELLQLGEIDSFRAGALLALVVAGIAREMDAAQG